MIQIIPVGKYRDFATSIADSLREDGLPVCLSIAEEEEFPDGERYHALTDDPRGEHVVIVGGTIDDHHTFDLFDLGCAASKYGARSVILAIPYFGYSTMERANPEKGCEVVKAKTRARMFSSIPIASRGNTVLLMDLHTDMTHYFEGGVHPMHLYAKPAIITAIQKLAGDDFVLASPDAGRAKWVESLAHELNVPAAVALKERISGSKTKLKAIGGGVKGKRVVLYDDMIRTGGTLLHAAQAFLDAGAIEVFAAATHGVFPGNALEKMHTSGAIKKLIASDSHPRAVMLAQSDKFGQYLSIAPTAPIFVEALVKLLK